MNPTEQKNHTRVTDDLAKTMSDFADITADRFVALERLIQVAEDSARALVNAERTFRLTLADEQRYHVDAADKAMYDTFRAFRDRGFWSRLNWLIRGQ